jgi:hypothetical protein
MWLASGAGGGVAVAIVKQWHDHCDGRGTNRTRQAMIRDGHGDH